MKIKLRDFLKILSGYNDVQLYDNNNKHLGWYNGYHQRLTIPEEYQSKNMVELQKDKLGQLVITIEKI